MGFPCAEFVASAPGKFAGRSKPRVVELLDVLLGFAAGGAGVFAAEQALERPAAAVGLPHESLAGPAIAAGGASGSSARRGVALVSVHRAGLGYHREAVGSFPAARLPVWLDFLPTPEEQVAVTVAAVVPGSPDVLRFGPAAGFRRGDGLSRSGL